MPSPTRRDLVPSSRLPLAYFVFAHLALGAGLVALAADPTLPGGHFYHPRMIALVHMVTLGWISGSILGAFYIVAPLALRLPLPVGRVDWAACAAFVIGTAGMVGHLWFGDETGMVPDAVLVTAAITWVASRAWRGLSHAAVPWPVTLHVALAFANMLLAALLGMLVGLDRARGFLGLRPLAATFAHAHLAAVGWAVMMVVGLSYRLIPMMLPAAMPTGRGLATSAVAIEAGLLLVVVALLRGASLLPVGAIVIVAGLASFVLQMRRTVSRRLPRPPALPRRDWSTWHAHVAIGWLVVAASLGVVTSLGPAGAHHATLQWVYGVAGLVGFLAQIVVGMQGRLVPLYAWYRAFDARGGLPPERGANQLPRAVYARTLFLIWTPGVPLLAWGLAATDPLLIRSAAVVLAGGVVVGLAYLRYLLAAAREGAGAPLGTPVEALTAQGLPRRVALRHRPAAEPPGVPRE